MKLKIRFVPAYLRRSGPDGCFVLDSEALYRRIVSSEKLQPIIGVRMPSGALTRRGGHDNEAIHPTAAYRQDSVSPLVSNRASTRGDTCGEALSPPRRRFSPVNAIHIRRFSPGGNTTGGVLGDSMSHIYTAPVCAICAGHEKNDYSVLFLFSFFVHVLLLLSLHTQLTSGLDLCTRTEFQLLQLYLERTAKRSCARKTAGRPNRADAPC
jgi:hypothetical protein